MAGMEDIRGAYTGLGTAGRVAAVAAVVAVVACAVSAVGLGVALLGPSPGLAANQTQAKEQAEQHAAAFDKYVSQIDGRSLFFIPAPPAALPPVAEARDDTPRDEPAPARYGGPAVVAMVNGSVWFENGRRISPGDESDGDIEVIRVEAPWRTVLKWKGVEFTVKLFEPDSLIGKAREPGEAIVVADFGPGSPTPRPDAAKPKSDAVVTRPGPPGTPGAPPTDPGIAPESAPTSPGAPPTPPADPGTPDPAPAEPPQPQDDSPTEPEQAPQPPTETTPPQPSGAAAEQDASR